MVVEHSALGMTETRDIHMLAAYEKSADDLVVVEKERYEDRIAVPIKRSVRRGTYSASRLLGYPYGLTGIVEHGKKLEGLGFPLFNVAQSDRAAQRRVSLS